MCECYFCNTKNVMVPICDFSHSCHCASCVLERYHIDIQAYYDEAKDEETTVFCMECNKVFENPEQIEDNNEYVKLIEKIIKHNCALCKGTLGTPTPGGFLSKRPHSIPQKK